jgi:hypothetical protein
MLVHRPVRLPPNCNGLDASLVDEPPVTHGVPAGAGRIDQFRSEPLHPAVQGHVVHVDAALGEDLLRVRYDNPYRRFQRTASMITSGENRNPANDDGA